ncbi:hypothetical protein Tco_0090763 [Tanacetum coccineum]
MVNEGIALDAGLESKVSTYDNTSTEQQDGSSSSRHNVDAERARGDVVVFDVENVIIGPLLDNNTLMEVHHSNNGTFENVFALEIQHHGQHKVENYSKASREAQQATALLTKELERYKEKEKHFAKETTNESEYCKKDLSENEHLVKDHEHLKKIYKDLYDSIKMTRVQTKDNNDSLIAQLNKKSIENADLNAQILEKVLKLLL